MNRYDVWKHSLWTRKGVPGPKPVPYLGILRSLKEKSESVKDQDPLTELQSTFDMAKEFISKVIAYGNTAGFFKGTHGTDVELVQKYGKLVGVYNGHLPSLVVADPEIIRQISVKDFSTFPNRYALFKPLDEFKGAVVSATNAHWKFIRNTLTPAFSSGKMRMINPLIDACNKRLLANLEKQSTGDNPVDMKKIFGSYTMDVIASTAFGMDIDSQNDPQNPFVKNAKSFFKGSLSSPIFLLMIIFPILGRIATKLRIRPKYFMDALMFFKAAVLSAIQMRGSEDSIRKDLLQMMLNARKEDTKDISTDITKDASHVKERGLTVNEITGNAIVFFLAGYDTTANTLEFMTYCLATNPSCQDKLIAEIDLLILKEKPDYDNVQKLPYLEMVMCETLRLYCPAVRTNRVAEKDTVIGGYSIPKGTEIVFPIYVVHRDPQYWPDPEKFDPERFNDENKEKINSYAFMPFGHGPRNCIGMRLAQMEVKTSIVSILQKYRLLPCDETEIPVTIDNNAITLKPKHGIKLKTPKYKSSECPEYICKSGDIEQTWTYGNPEMESGAMKGYSKWKHSLWRRLQVPGPTPTPFFGILMTQRSKGIIQTNVELVEKYGKIVGIYHGHKPSLLVADPEVVKQVMVKDFASFPNRYALFEPGKLFKLTIFFAKDEHWKFIRNTLSPTFSTAKMKDMMPLIKKCYLQLLDNIERQSRDGKALDMKEIFGGYTMDVIASTAFGLEVDSQKDPNNEFVKSANAFFARSLTSTLQLLRIMIPGFSTLALYFTPEFITNGITFFKKAVAAAIDMRKKNGSDRKDFLDLMMNASKEMANNTHVNEHDGGQSTWKNRGLSLDEITSNSVLFFIAGYDTTANTLSFVSYNLAVYPEYQDKVIKEIDEVIGMSFPDYDNVQKLKYLDMVLCETLRLYGPVPRINRTTDFETEIAGYKIPANTEIAFPIYVIHRDPENWPEPEKFDPERFTAENKEKRHPYSFMPFGHGPRRCIGMRLAQMEAKTAIVYILQRYRFVRCDETEVPVTYDVNAPVFKAKNGIKLKLKPRN